MPPDAGASADLPEPLPFAAIGSKMARAWHRIHELEVNLELHRAELDRQLKLLASAHDRLAHSILPEQAAIVHSQLDRWQQTLQDIYASDAWRWLARYYRVRNRVFPPGSWRRSAAARLVRPFLRWPRRTKRVPAEPPVPQLVPGQSMPFQEALRPQPVNPGTFPAADAEYASWIANNEPDALELERQRATPFVNGPRISLVLDPEGASTDGLARTLQSLQGQTYRDWELVVVLANDDIHARQLETWRSAFPGPPWVRVARQATKAGGLNVALAVATGNYVAFVDAGDALAPFALYEIAQAIHRCPDADLLYSDEDRLCEPTLERFDHHFKPDWAPDTFRAHNYVGQLAVYSGKALEQSGGVREGFTGARHYDLLLRASEIARRIVHVPGVLYHRHGGQVSPHAAAEGVSRDALQEHLLRVGMPGEAVSGMEPDTFCIRHALMQRPVVSVIIANRDHPDLLRRSVHSVLQSSYDHVEVLIVENGSRQTATFECYRHLKQDSRVQILVWDRPFNFAAINNEAVRSASGEVLLFLNNDLQAIHRDWLERMLEHAIRPPIGAVGAKLYYSDDTVQHAGMLVGRDHGPCHLLLFQKRGEGGYGNRLATVQNLSVVTGACLMTRRRVFEEVSGFDEEFVIAYNDVDLCLKMRRQGYWNLWTPHAELYHFESVTRGFDDSPEKIARHLSEHQRFRERWAAWLPQIDPYYNPHLTLGRPDGSLRRGKVERHGEEAI